MSSEPILGQMNQKLVLFDISMCQKSFFSATIAAAGSACDGSMEDACYSSVILV